MVAPSMMQQCETWHPSAILDEVREAWLESQTKHFGGSMKVRNEGSQRVTISINRWCDTVQSPVTALKRPVA